MYKALPSSSASALRQSGHARQIRGCYIFQFHIVCGDTSTEMGLIEEIAKKPHDCTVRWWACAGDTYPCMSAASRLLPVRRMRLRRIGTTITLRR